MKSGEILRGVLAHICMICGIVVMTFQILDWYNPYMDFTGHSVQILYILCVCSVLSGIIQIFQRRKGVHPGRKLRQNRGLKRR